MGESKATDERVIRHDALLPQMFDMIQSIQTDLKDHLEWEQAKYEKIQENIEKVSKNCDDKIAKSEEKAKRDYAGIWVQDWVKAVAFVVFVALIITLLK